jgi:hypothetical protein
MAHNFSQIIDLSLGFSIELVLGRIPQPNSPPATGAVHLGDTSDVDGSEGALSNPESHTFGLPVLGGAGSLLPRRAGMHAHTLEGDPGRSSVSVSSSSSAAAAAMSAREITARGQVASPEPRSSSSRTRSSNSLLSEWERQGSRLQSAHSFGSQGSRQQQQQQQEEESPPSPSIPLQSVQSEDSTSGGSTTTRTVTLAQAMSKESSRVQTRAHQPEFRFLPRLRHHLHNLLHHICQGT